MGTLNLMIAIFSKVYKDNAGEAMLFFLQHRCDRTENLLLSPVWKSNFWRSDFNRVRDLDERDPEATVDEQDDIHDPHARCDMLPYVLSAACFTSWAVLSAATRPSCINFWLASLLAAALVLLQAAVMQNMWFNRDYYKTRLY